MITSFSEVAAEAISTAGLPPTTERNATRLLALVSDDSGHAVITWAALAALWDCSEAVARRHLGHIKSAGIIHYSSNRDVYVNFYAWESSKISTENVEKFDGKRAWTRDEQTIDPHTPDTDRRKIRRKTSKNSTENVEKFDDHGDPGGDNRGGESERDLIIPLPEKNSLTHSLSDAERKMSIAALTDQAVGMSVYTASKLAAQYPFPDIRAFCIQFVEESHLPGRVPGTNAGLIAYRLEASETIPPTVHGDFYQRHRTPAEIAAETAQRLADEQAAAALRAQWAAEDAAKAAQTQTAPVNAPPAGAADIWTAALADLALSMPAPTFEEWLRDTDVLGYTDGEFVIGVPHAYARDWLHNRLRPQIRRTLSRITQRSTDVSFAVRPRETQEATDVRENR